MSKVKTVVFEAPSFVNRFHPNKLWMNSESAVRRARALVGSSCLIVPAGFDTQASRIGEMEDAGYFDTVYRNPRGPEEDFAEFCDAMHHLPGEARSEEALVVSVNPANMKAAKLLGGTVFTMLSEAELLVARLNPAEVIRRGGFYELERYLEEAHDAPKTAEPIPVFE